MSMYESDPTDPMRWELAIPPDEERRMKTAQAWARRFRWATWIFLLLTAGAALVWGNAQDSGLRK